MMLGVRVLPSGSSIGECLGSRMGVVRSRMGVVAALTHPHGGTDSCSTVVRGRLEHKFKGGVEHKCITGNPPNDGALVRCAWTLEYGTGQAPGIGR